MIDFNKKKGFICDMDGVVYHGNKILPGVVEFIDWLRRAKKEFLFLTNNSCYTLSHEKGPSWHSQPGNKIQETPLSLYETTEFFVEPHYPTMAADGIGGPVVAVVQRGCSECVHQHPRLLCM